MRWLPALVMLGVVLVSGTVVADVVLAYTANTSVGPNTAGPFQFANGGNYASANAIGVVANVYPSGSVGPTVTTTLHGIQSVPVEIYNVTVFETIALTTRPATLGNVNVPAPATITVAGVVCAYAFVSTAIQSFGGTGVPGAPAGCSATLPTLGTIAPACGTGATAATATVNLLTGIVAGAIGTCPVPSGTAATTIALYVSYAITTNASVAGTTALNPFTIPVTLT